jgi:hypothetical protein
MHHGLGPAEDLPQSGAERRFGWNGGEVRSEAGEFAIAIPSRQRRGGSGNPESRCYFWGMENKGNGPLG